VARDSDLLAARHDEEGAGTFDAVIGGKKLLSADHGCGAQQVLADELDDVAADSPRMGAAHHGIRTAGTQNESGRRR
jgi:hypothetical protein